MPKPEPGWSVAALTVPNVFVSYECGRAEIAEATTPGHIHETYAVCGEDVIVEGLLAARLALQRRTLAGLVYVAIGAVHAVQGSSTYLFYRKHGASGVVVTPEACDVGDIARVRPRDLVLQGNVLAAMPGRDPLPQTIEAVMARPGGRPVDFLTIETGSDCVQTLESLNLDRLRPLAIQCPSGVNAPAQTLVRFLRTRGYVLAASTDENLIFLDATGIEANATPPRLNSFDVFDTLIARRCVDPLRIHALVEARLGIPGLAARRREAELAVSGTHTTLESIHTELAARLGLDAATAAAVKQAEIETELEQVIPVAENLARVQPGDLLLSDMYLPPDIIRALLEKAGLDRPVGLVVTANGKVSGQVWPQVRAHVSIGRHLGDNAAADVEMPRRFGIVSEHTRLTEPTPVERWCLDNGLRSLGELIRAARLQIATPDPIGRRLQVIQTQFNFPILLLGSIALHRHALATGAKRLLFASRDCHLWQELHATLFPDGPAVEYFYTSRRARVQGSAAYRAYAADRLSPNSLLIDLCGSGWSSARMIQSLDLPGRGLYFLHQIAAVPLYEQQHPTPDVCEIAATIGPARQGLDHMRFEMCNYALHGSVTDVRTIANVAVPLFDTDDRSTTERELVGAQMHCFRAMIADCKGRRIADSITLRDADITEIAARLYALLSQEQCLVTAFGTSHHREDLRTLGALELLPGS